MDFKTEMNFLFEKLNHRYMEKLKMARDEHGGNKPGAERVRLSFNPSGNTDVSEIKLATSQLIDYCEAFKLTGEQARYAALAQTAYEEAAMWAVKAATYQPK